MPMMFIRTNRGGLITYHGPGQLVAYPIIKLRGPELAGKGLRWFVDALEQSGLEVCQAYQGATFLKGSELFPETRGATGIWANKRNKVMSIGMQSILFQNLLQNLFSLIGVHGTRDVTYHGVGLNCTKEPLKWFDKVVPCGLPDCEMTSLETVTGIKISPADVAPKLSERLFANLFNHQISGLECTYSDFLSKNRSLSSDKVAQFILEDADFRTKQPCNQKSHEHWCS